MLKYSTKLPAAEVEEGREEGRSGWRQGEELQPGTVPSSLPLHQSRSNRARTRGYVPVVQARHHALHKVGKTRAVQRLALNNLHGRGQRQLQGGGEARRQQARKGGESNARTLLRAVALSSDFRRSRFSR